MAHYTNITLKEMTAFLTNPNFPGGPFVQVFPEGYTEAAFSRLISKGKDGSLYALRVNTGIVGEDSRECGKDAVRVAIFWKETKESKPRMIMGSKRVHRVENWQANLLNRIIGFGKPTLCPCCGKPLAIRKNKAKNTKFLACLGWTPDRNGCNYTTDCPEDMD